jgi:hypothetical protein
LSGLIAGVLLNTIFFLAVLRFAKPDDDYALEVYAFPLLFLLRRSSGNRKDRIRSFKGGTRSDAAAGSFAAHDGRLSRILASLLGPGYASRPTAKYPSRIHSGFRTATIFLIVFLIAYWASGKSTFSDLANLKPWTNGYSPNSVLNFLLLVLIFWDSLLTGVTFFVDRFRLPALVVLPLAFFLIAQIGISDHFFYTFPSQADSKLPTPTQVLQNTPEDTVIVVAAAGGGIQSAAWTSRVLCGLRADFRPTVEGKVGQFESDVLVISGVSGGSVGTMFYLRCLEGAQDDQTPADWAQNSSLEAVAWGLTHPDLRRIFFPLPSAADRGWALERSFLKSAQFKNPKGLRLADARDNPHWPILLLNSSDAQTGDPVVFTNSDFANHVPDPKKPPKHNLHNFRDTAGADRDVFLETAARMSAAFPYVSPEARPDNVKAGNGVHLGDGGYFDNSGVFALSEWLKEAVTGQTKKRRILFLELDAFPDSGDNDTQKPEKWYYQVYSPIATMLNVRSESQVVRDKTSGEDLQSILNQEGFQTTWLLVRYEPPTSVPNPYASNPPLSWHLTETEKSSINQAWLDAEKLVKPAIGDFLHGPPNLTSGTCDQYHALGNANGNADSGVFERRCAAAVTQPASARQ